MGKKVTLAHGTLSCSFKQSPILAHALHLSSHRCTGIRAYSPAELGQQGKIGRSEAFV